MSPGQQGKKRAAPESSNAVDANAGGSSNPPKRQKETEDHNVEAQEESGKINVEERGISVNQLIEIVDIITQRCNIERWTSTLDGMYC